MNHNSLAFLSYMQHREARSDPEYQTCEQHINNMRRQQVRSSRQASFRVLSYQPEHFYNTTDIGTLSLQCSNCGALKFERETDSLCCSKGNVQLDNFHRSNHSYSTCMRVQIVMVNTFYPTYVNRTVHFK